MSVVNAIVYVTEAPATALAVLTDAGSIEPSVTVTPPAVPVSMSEYVGESEYSVVIVALAVSCVYAGFLIPATIIDAAGLPVVIPPAWVIRIKISSPSFVTVPECVLPPTVLKLTPDRS